MYRLLCFCCELIGVSGGTPSAVGPRPIRSVGVLVVGAEFVELDPSFVSQERIDANAAPGTQIAWIIQVPQFRK